MPGLCPTLNKELGCGKVLDLQNCILHSVEKQSSNKGPPFYSLGGVGLRKKDSVGARKEGKKNVK